MAASPPFVFFAEFRFRVYPAAALQFLLQPAMKLGQGLKDIYTRNHLLSSFVNIQLVF